MRRCRIIVLTGVAFALVLPAVAAAKVRLTTEPGLRPSYSAAVRDYVSRCVPGRALRLSAEATDGDRVAVGSTAPRRGEFTTEVERKTGAAVSVRVVVEGGATRTHRIRCLPRDFPRWTFRRHRTPQSQWYVVTPIGPSAAGYVALFDTRGVPVWWMRSSWYGPWDAKLLETGNLIWSRQLNNLFSADPDVAWEERGLDGRLVRTLKTVGSPTDWHDLTRTPDGNYLLESYRPRHHVDLRAHGGPRDATVYDGVIEELTPDGDLVWSWNSKDHIALSENTWWKSIHRNQARRPPKDRFYDLVHINSMEPDGDGVIVSARFLDAVFRIDKKTGGLTWKLGGTKRATSLKLKGDPLTHPFDGQHDARLFGDGSVTVYDNGTARKRPPRALRYRLDLGKRSARLVEDHRNRGVPRSGWGGSARKLPGGNWVVYWGGTTLMTEQTASGKPVVDLNFKDGRHSYRAFPIPRGRLRARALRRGMAAIVANGRGEIGR